jgi:outer membrane receptor protein involved in Fe transport
VILKGLRFVLIVSIFLASAASAQQSTGSIKGIVNGADSGVVVEVSDVSRGVTKSKIVDADGAFRFDGLTLGAYDIRVLSDAHVLDSQSVNVTLGGTVSVVMATTTAAIEEIIVSGMRVAALDTSIAEIGMVITSDVLLDMPVQRDLTSVAMLAPGVSRGKYRFGDQGNISFAGASVAENTSFVNGLNTTNFRTGLGFSVVPFEFYETLQIKTGGYSAKYGRSLGGVMNTRTKSGSNDWSAGANVYYNDLINTSPETYSEASDQAINKSTNLNAFLSGAIWKDRIFFYVLVADSDQTQQYAYVQSGRGYKQTIDETFWGIKLDGYINEDHHLEFTAFSDERTGIESAFQFDADTDTWGTYLGDTLHEKGGENWIATYTGDITDNFRVVISYGENNAAQTIAPSDADIPVVIEYTNAGGFEFLGDWTSFNAEIGEDSREMTRVDLSWVIGNHTLDGGLDFEVNTAFNTLINSGGVYWLHDPLNEYNGCTPQECPRGANVRQRTFQVGGSFETSSKAYYIQDVWDVNDKLTLELGLRNEIFENLNASGDPFVKIDDQWAPRIAAVWDPTGMGGQKVFANWGLYYIPVAAIVSIAMAGGETYVHDYFDWDGVSVDSQFVPQNLGPLYETVVFADGSVPDTRSTTDTTMNAMYQSEFILGYSFSTGSGIELGIKTILRELKSTIEDVSIDGGVVEYYNNGDGTWDPTLTGGAQVEDVFWGLNQYVLTNPGSDMNIYIPEQDEYIDLTAEQLGYPNAKRTYKAIELTLNRPFDGTWSINASYTWASNRGNHEGYFRSDSGQAASGITINFDTPGLADWAFGDLPNNHTHTIKVFGSHGLENGLRFGSSIFWQTGRPLNCFGVHPTELWAQDYGAQSHFCDGQPVPRGSVGETPSVLNVDLGVQYNWVINKFNILFAVDVFNIFNSANETDRNEYTEVPSGLPDPYYGEVTQYQAPRSLRLSARVQFN